MIDKLCYSSKLRYLNPFLKSAFACTSLLICIASRSILIGLIVLFTMSVLTVHFGKIKFQMYIKMLTEILTFLILSTIAILFSVTTASGGLFSFPILGHYLTIYPESAALTVQLIITAFSSISCLYFLSLSTPMTDILVVLKRLHCPALIIELMLLMYRFIFLLLEVANAITTAQKARLGNRNYKTALKSMGQMLAALLARAFQRSKNLYTSMESRCYNGSINILEEYLPAERKHILYVTVFEILLIACSVLERSF